MLSLHGRFSRKECGRMCDICAEKHIFINRGQEEKMSISQLLSWRPSEEDKDDIWGLIPGKQGREDFYCSFQSDLFFLPGSIWSQISSAAFRAHVAAVSSFQSCNDCGCVPVWIRGQLLSAKPFNKNNQKWDALKRKDFYLDVFGPYEPEKKIKNIKPKGNVSTLNPPDPTTVKKLLLLLHSGYLFHSNDSSKTL